MIVIATVGIVAAAAIAATEEHWEAPARASAKKNPIAADAASIGRGKAIYTAECASCHGNSGRGDGPSAKDLEKSPGDMTKVGDHSDGALFYKITEGKKPMPSFAKKLSGPQRWDVVNYLRTIK